MYKMARINTSTTNASTYITCECSLSTMRHKTLDINLFGAINWAKHILDNLSQMLSICNNSAQERLYELSPMMKFNIFLVSTCAYNKCTTFAFHVILVILLINLTLHLGQNAHHCLQHDIQLVIIALYQVNKLYLMMNI